MKIGVRLFLSSMLFAAVISTAYGFTTHDVVGVFFLGTMALALIIVAIFIVVAERESNLAGDREDLTAADMAGEELGVFSLESYWPILAAAGVTLTLFGIVFLPGISLGLLLVGGALILWTARFLVREST
jgi:hypothetical protein